MADTTDRSDVRSTVVAAAATLLHEHGPAAVTTRGVAQGAGVQAPTIYRLFGDKDGLLDAVAEHVLAQYVSAKSEIVDAAATAGVDALDDLRSGWEMQIEFGLANPAIFRLLSDPDRVRESSAARAGKRILENRIHRIAQTGRLRVGEPRAVALVQAAAIGAIQTLLATPVDDRDWGLADAMYDAVLWQILVDAPERPEHGAAATVIAFRAIAPQLDALSDAERGLLVQWLDRAIDAAD